MKPGTVLRQMLRERRRTVLWWTLAVLALTAITAASYPAVRDMGSALEQVLEFMPEGTLELMGAAGGITSPAGYLNSQLYSNILPILLLIFGIGTAAWTVAGAEREGTLEPLLANPVSRSRTALERFTGTAILLSVPTLAMTLLLIVLRTPFELGDVDAGKLVAAGVGTYLLVLLFVSLTYAVGAATGSKGGAIATGAGAAAATYVVFALSSFVDFFRDLRVISPWHWFLDNSPLIEGWNWPAIGVPLLVVIPAVALGTALFTQRDLR